MDYYIWKKPYLDSRAVSFNVFLAFIYVWPWLIPFPFKWNLVFPWHGDMVEVFAFQYLQDENNEIWLGIMGYEKETLVNREPVVQRRTHQTQSIWQIIQLTQGLANIFKSCSSTYTRQKKQVSYIVSWTSHRWCILYKTVPSTK